MFNLFFYFLFLFFLVFIIFVQIKPYFFFHRSVQVFDKFFYSYPFNILNTAFLTFLNNKMVRRSTRIQGRTVTGQARAKKSTSSKITKPKRSKNTAAKPVKYTRRPTKKVKFAQEPSASQIVATSRNIASQPPSIATVQESQVASSVVIQDTTIPQVTTTTIPVMQRKRGRPPKVYGTSTAGSGSYVNGRESTLTASAVQVSRKRGYHVLEEEHKLALKPKRRKGDTFTVPIPIRPQQAGQVYAIGSNDCFQCGMGETVESLKKVRRIPDLSQFNIVDISAGSIHSAALTVDGKVVTWGCNDHGELLYNNI